VILEGTAVLTFFLIMVVFHSFPSLTVLMLVEVKIMLSAFEQLSGPKINFHKSEMFCYGKAKDWHFEYSRIFGCELGAMPFRYLGIPMHHKRLSNSDWKDLLDKFQKRLSSWKIKLLSIGGRLTLLNFILSSLSLFMFSFFEVPKEVLKKWRLLGLDCFGKMRGKRRNITSPSGMFCAPQKTKVGWVF
jgi:hypothetical protein